MPVILIYLAQWYDYPEVQGSTNQTEISVLKSMLSKTADTQITLMGHSWSAHIALHEAKDYSNVSLGLFNPGQRPYSDIASQFVSDIQNSKNKQLTIIAGGQDDVSIGGHGQYVMSPAAGGGLSCTANCDILTALNGSSSRSQVVVGSRFFDSYSWDSAPAVGHGLKQMLDNGAGTAIPKPVL